MTATTDVLIIGGGVIGLAIAVELRLRSLSVTVLVRNFNAAASHAAAGMLAPQAEQIPPGAMLDLCLLSRSLYPDWINKIEQISGISTGYWRCGILAPSYAEANKQRETRGDRSFWLGKEAISHQQPGLGAEIVGGWWYPEDAQVDNRALTFALRAAAQALGVDIRDVAVEAIEYEQNRVTGVRTAEGMRHSDRYILATGAWSNQLLPIPVSPKKGQMLSVQVPNVGELPLQQVLFAPDIYIVPRQDGRIIIGATVEDVGFVPHNTPAGIQALLQNAIGVYPQLQHYPIYEFWWGFRPATPDELPILGASPYQNLTLATGHYRNGILLTPVTANLIADAIANQYHPLLEHFHYSRFVT